MKTIFLLKLALLLNGIANAQGISINTDNTPPDPSAILDVQSSSKGLLIPRMTIDNRDLIATPAAGLMIYQTDGVPGLYMYDGNVWQVLTTSSNVWSTAGNGGTDPANAFVGTTDNTPLRFRVNNKWAGELNMIYWNLSVGDSSGIVDQGFFNTSFGHKSLKANQFGVENIAVGYEALVSNGESYNTAVGFWAMHTNTAGYSNTAIGNRALEYNTYGYRNTALGRWALNYNVGGYENTAVGYASLSSSHSGFWNVAIGHRALYSMPNGDGNVAVGTFAMESSLYTYDNVAVGQSAMRQNINGSSNLALGSFSLRYNLDGNDNCAVGSRALYSNITSDFNTAVGTAALQNNLAGNNTALGYKSMVANAEGEFNTAVGSNALSENTTASYSVAIGSNALRNSNRSGNVAIGYEALYANTTGSSNTAVGFKSLFSNGDGDYNTAMGLQALLSNYTGENNVAIGSQSLLTNTAGSYCIALGVSALSFNETGNYNIALGYNSGTHSSYTGLYNTIGVGNNGSLHQIDNQVIIGNTATDYIGGYEPWTTFSDARMKFDVREDVVGLNFINRLRPVTYYRDVDIPAQITGDEPLPDFPHKYDVESVRQTGFLAQEVEAAANASGYDFSGVTIPRNEHMLYAVSYESFVVPLVKAVQEQQSIIDAQQQQITTLEARLNAMETLLQNSLPKTR